jgi:hypothetical protein
MAYPAAADCDEISEAEAFLLEAYSPLEMARLIVALTAEHRWLSQFADIRSKDDSKTFARVNRGALRTIAERAGQAANQVLA